MVRWKHSPLLLIGLSVVLVVAGLAFLLIQTGDDSARNSLESYYMEIELEIEPSEEANDLDGPPADRVRVWFAAPDSFKQEYGRSDPTLDYLARVLMSDGETLWYYDALSNSYSYTDVTDDMTRGAGLIAGGFLIGQIPGESVDAFLQQLTQPAGSSYEVRGSDTILGRTVDVIDVNAAAVGSTTIWVDREFEFVLRYEHHGDQNVRVEVSHIEYNAKLPLGIFAFEPPPGARGVQGRSGATSGSSAMGSGPGIAVLSPPGFRTPAYLPPGYEARGTSNSSGPGGLITQFGVNYERGDGPSAYVKLRQVMRSGDVPSGLRTAMSVQVGASEGYVRLDSGETSLVWMDDGLMTILRSNTENAGELVRIAESVR